MHYDNLKFEKENILYTFRKKIPMILKIACTCVNTEDQKVIFFFFFKVP